ncbi:MAG TPA: thiamine pyrophosphate-dependent dehydrogenase E1 component subunit alpha [Spirochaetia bacterium]|nr:thiamine pyrophosphate-dependent dehydrogenase E1 component subunit alpha [Spirochaetia bacterium]
MDQRTAEWIYRTMYAIRVFELKVEELFAAGELPGFVHLYIGQEACAVGVCAHLKPEDYITSTHRGHGHCIAKGGKLDRMMAELYAKSTGYNKGKGGSMHLASTEDGILGANGINAAGMPLAVGAALSAKMQKNGRIAIAFFGDGASNQGTFHESINLAAAFQLPVVFVCENNQFAVGTRISETARIANIADRASAYGIPGKIADGMNALEVYEAAGRCIEKAREGEGPSILELKTWRFRAHFQGEPATYRSKKDEEAWLKKDPLNITLESLAVLNLLTQQKAKEIEGEIQEELAKAVEFARTSPDPQPEEALTDIFA